MRVRERSVDPCTETNGPVEVVSAVEHLGVEVAKELEINACFQFQSVRIGEAAGDKINLIADMGNS